jgi:hemerythrin
MLEWKSDYETGVLSIDEQHKVLFDHINQLGQLLEKEKIDRAEAHNLLTFLENYAKRHFNGEENCMARFRCPAYAKNKEDHALFLNMFEFYTGQDEITSTSKATLERLHQSMVWWINQHILKVDIQLKDSVEVKPGQQ